MKKLLLSAAALCCFMSARAQWSTATFSGHVYRTGITGVGGPSTSTASTPPPTLTDPGVKFYVNPQGPGGILVGNPNTSSGSNTALFLNVSAAQNGYSYLQSIIAGVSGSILALNPNGGNVGIGTSSPSRKLEVLGGSTWLHRNNNGAAAPTLDLGDGLNWTHPMFSFITSDNGGGNTLKTQSYRDMATFLWTRNNGSMAQISGDAVGGNALSIFDKSTTAQVTNISLASNGISYFNGGNVGIGTSNPGTYKLAVEGKAGAREVVVTTAPWADYVFASDYKLRPLSEVARFIAQNKHLPEVPTAAEIEKNGNNLGDTDALLLKKIEELTLYVIEQNKKMEAQEKQSQVQQKEIEALKQQVAASRK